jgi:hypothetical protein
MASSRTYGVPKRKVVQRRQETETQHKSSNKTYLKDVDQKDWEILFLGKAIWAKGLKVAELERETAQWKCFNLEKFNCADKQDEIEAKLAKE